MYAVTGELFFASSNDLVYQFDYRGDPANVIIQRRTPRTPRRQTRRRPLTVLERPGALRSTKRGQPRGFDLPLLEVRLLQPPTSEGDPMWLTASSQSKALIGPSPVATNLHVP